MPARLSQLDAVDLPMPIDPVRPTTMGRGGNAEAAPEIIATVVATKRRSIHWYAAVSTDYSTLVCAVCGESSRLGHFREVHLAHGDTFETAVSIPRTAAYAACPGDLRAGAVCRYLTNSPRRPCLSTVDGKAREGSTR